MAKNVQKIAEGLGAKIVGKVPYTGGGAFGAARLAEIMKQRLVPSAGKRAGRPANPAWDQRPKVPMSKKTLRRLQKLAQQASTKERKVTAMQIAAQLLEESVFRFPSPAVSSSR